MDTATEQDLTEIVRRLGREAGFDEVGITDVRPSEHAAFYRAWIAAGRHGSMAYLAREDALTTRVDPSAGFPGLRSAIVVALNYAQPVDTADPSSGVIARYALGRDYHKVLKQKLNGLLHRIESEIGRELPLARAYVDTGPILERELAQRAGLGWQGRSTMLVHPRRGSYFFIGTLLTELELTPDPPFERDHCGTCNACVDVCPTGALLGRDESGAPVMDATRCISYLTIENRGEIPRELRPLIGNRIFGCDICQEVCPWNGPKFVRITEVRDFDGREREGERKHKRLRDIRGKCATEEGCVQQRELPGTTLPSLIALMRMTYEEWDEWTRGSAIRRAGYAGLKRNVAVALGNWGSPAAVPVLLEALSDPEALVREHTAWALARVGTAEARTAVSAHASLETDARVLEELSVAMGA